MEICKSNEKISCRIALLEMNIKSLNQENAILCQNQQVNKNSENIVDA